MYATRTRKVKTDRRAHRLSDDQRHVRGRLLVRDALVRTRTRDISVIRPLLLAVIRHLNRQLAYSDEALERVAP